MSAGVPWSSVLWNILYHFYTTDVPNGAHTTTAMFNDNATISPMREHKLTATDNLWDTIENYIFNETVEN